MEGVLETITNPWTFQAFIGHVLLQTMSFFGRRTSTSWAWATTALLSKVTPKIVKWPNPFKLCTETGSIAMVVTNVPIRASLTPLERGKVTNINQSSSDC